MDPADWKGLSAAKWDQVAPTWARLAPEEAEAVQRLTDRLACDSGSFIFDAGCGAGRCALALAASGYRVWGIDLSPQMVEQARARARAPSQDVARFDVGDVERLTIPDETFDGIVCNLVLDWVPSPGAALTELRRVLKPGGRLVVSTLGAYSPVKRHAWRRFLPECTEDDLANHILPWEVEALLGELGWQILAQEPGFGPSVSGERNPYTPETCSLIHDRVLLQSLATTWEISAMKPMPG